MEPELCIGPLSVDEFDLDYYSGRQELYLCLAATLEKAILKAGSDLVSEVVPVKAYCLIEDVVAFLRGAAECEAEARRTYAEDMKAGVA